VHSKTAVKTDFTSSHISQRTVNNAHVTTSAFGDLKITASNLVSERQFVAKIIGFSAINLNLSLSSLCSKEMK
jgi:hypothetical protein